MKKVLFVIVMIFLLNFTACSSKNNNSPIQNEKNTEKQLSKKKDKSSRNISLTENNQQIKLNNMKISNKNQAIHTITQPATISVLVNKQYFLPKNYTPKNLVYPNVSFIFKEKIEKRKMRKEAALALQKLFAGAKKDKIFLSGVSAYRSYATQKAVFNRYVKEDGYANARKYSALPGSSEHQTGLSIDVSSSTGKCAAQSCFGSTKEAKWLASKSANYGFIIRYPKGKESITGYKYEPWHIRYVGISTSKQIKKRNLTLEEYLHVYPVSK
ncbi:D-alanyl-D-alanine carboxypeptidase family protein [Bacillus sp. EAC]|uniref:M15 family metallopeptidase n=1 Tax=Bacillus sp. EAC TaxID=1978338 RepID=UPI000B43BBE2|nr:M15 family metallopeptidase [Bacillus sp. EAC]